MSFGAVSTFAWVLIAAFAFPNAKIAKADTQVVDHNHEEQHHTSNYEFNSHDETGANEDSHSHEHRHGSEEPLRSHEHKRSSQVNASDGNLATRRPSTD